jgi:hypothetical protein
MAIPFVAIAMVVAALVPAVADLIGKALASGDMNEAKRISDEAIKRYDIPIPAIEEMAAKLGPSAMAGIQADPQSVSAQRSALADLQRYGREGADNIEYRAAMDAATRDVNRSAAGRDGALRQEMQARGMGNTGMEYALRQQSNSAAADRMAGMGFDAALGGRRAALQSLQAGAGLAGQMRRQGFDEDSARARAADDINRFNEASRAGAVRDRFGMQMGQADKLYNADINRANLLAGQAAQTQQQWANYGQAAGAGAGAYAQYESSEEERRRREKAGGA